MKLIGSVFRNDPNTVFDATKLCQQHRWCTTQNLPGIPGRVASFYIIFSSGRLENHFTPQCDRLCFRRRCVPATVCSECQRWRHSSNCDNSSDNGMSEIKDDSCLFQVLHTYFVVYDVLVSPHTCIEVYLLISLYYLRYEWLLRICSFHTNMFLFFYITHLSLLCFFTTSGIFEQELRIVHVQ